MKRKKFPIWIIIILLLFLLIAGGIFAVRVANEKKKDKGDIIVDRKSVV